MRIDTDIVVVGSGCFGSLVALVARQAGFSVTLLERGCHPRFAIGESSTPLSNLLLEEIARSFNLPWLAGLSKYGPWRRTQPQLRCGKKRGFTFVSHPAHEEFLDRSDRGDQFLVAASPNDDIADTHWLRADLDAFLVDQAQMAGVRYLDRVEISTATVGWPESILKGIRDGKAAQIHSKLVIDASGPRGFLWQQLMLGESSFESMPRAQALFTHFEDVQQLKLSAGTPYPANDAAVHHMLPDGWVWSLRFDDGITSAGVCATPSLAEELRLEDGAEAWQRLLARQPTLGRIFGGASSLHPFVHQSQVSFRTPRASGPGWIMLPSAAASIDPLLSTGFPLALSGILRLGRLLTTADSNCRDSLAHLEPGLEAIAVKGLAEADRAASLIGAIYTSLNDFSLVRMLTRLYFAPVSFQETRIRLGHADATEGFLSMDDPAFGAALLACCQAAQVLSPGNAKGRGELIQAIQAAIKPIDILGLDNPAFEAWLPVDLPTLLRRRDRLGATEAELQAMIDRCHLRASPAL